LAGLFGMICSNEKTVNPAKPPEVKAGKPICFSSEDYNWRKWHKASGNNSFAFFVVYDDEDKHWFIDWDADRQPFTTIVIHHSATDKNTTAAEIEKIQKERLYAPRYKSASKTPFVKGLPMHSGHVVNGKERFIGYHHLVYHDGKVTTELSPLRKKDDKWYVDHVAWHAGNWNVNCSSVAICLIGNFSEEFEEDGEEKIRQPSDAQFRATAGLIAYYRTINPKVTITGHSDHRKTDCPGLTWPLWKKKIMPR